MSSKSRDYRDYIQDILDSIDEIENFIEGMKFEEFVKDKKTINAVTRSVEVIGEAAKKIPKSIRNKYPTIPWKKISGMRDKLIHEYFGIDLEILWKVARDNIPPLRLTIKNILEDLGG
jgi:uncharacterized protein with HEPN domain